jgi:hypothetical protein
MYQTTVRYFHDRLRHVLVLAPLTLIVASTAGCKERCQSRIEPDGTADFSSLRLSGRLLCASPGKCEGEFSGNALKFLTTPGEDGLTDAILYDVAYQGTHEQEQNVLVEGGGLGSCDKFRREVWVVPTVSMTFRSATRNGQPLAIDDTGKGLLPTYRELTVVTHYVDRAKSDEYVGVLLGGVIVEGRGLDVTLTKSGQNFRFVPENAH